MKIEIVDVGEIRAVALVVSAQDLFSVSNMPTTGAGDHSSPGAWL